MTKKFYTAKYDRVFKTIFSKEDDSSLLQEFLGSILDKKVEVLSILKNEMEEDSVLERENTIDVYTRMDGKDCYIELTIGGNVKNLEAFHEDNFRHFLAFYKNHITKENQYDLETKFLHLDFTYGLGTKIESKKAYSLVSNKEERYLENFEMIEYNLDKMMQFWKDGCQEEIEKYKHFIMLDLGQEDLTKLAEKDALVATFKEKITKLNEDDAFQNLMMQDED